jgi:prephenate dehydrogenase
LDVAVIGVGLIGGSVGLAARERLGARVRGFDPAGCGQAAEPADSLAAAVQDASVTFVAVPVGALRTTVETVLAAAPADCVVTDVGSTKRPLAGIEDPRFIGGHPLAGAETSGVEHARADLFDGATWYLTPTGSTEGVLYDRLQGILRGLGARPQALDAEIHDRLMATVSHLPHVLANVLVAQAARALDEEGEALPATGPSFRDATRVAGAPTSIWRDIYTSNADALGAVLDETIERLRAVRATLGDGGAVAQWNDAAREDRDRLLGASLTGEDVQELRVSVPNRPGVVAEVALALGRRSVNIVDMALYPAADNASGVIAIWVGGDAAPAERVVAELGLPVARA